jgi:hypothetical protein
MVLAVTVPDVLLQRCFPELREFVLLDARRVHDAVPDANGRGLLDLFSASVKGRVAVEGIAARS